MDWDRRCRVLKTEIKMLTYSPEPGRRPWDKINALRKELAEAEVARRRALANVFKVERHVSDEEVKEILAAGPP
jgi:hypothetical protein